MDFPEAKSGCQWYNVGPTNDENVGLLKAHEYYSWLVVSNMSYFPFHIWDVTLPIDELIFFKTVIAPPTSIPWKYLGNSREILEMRREIPSNHRTTILKAPF